MPNWCDNTVIIYFDNKDKKQMDYITKLAEQARQNKLLTFLKPYNENEKDLYHWCIKNWGTKWDIDYLSHTLLKKEGKLIISFQTAWSPPTAAFDAIIDDFRFELYYYETGVGFYGMYNNDGESSFEVSTPKGEKVNWSDEQDIERVFRIMMERDGFTKEQADMFCDIGLPGCYFNEDYEEEMEDEQTETNA
jgi:hypothetical protein